MNSLGGPVSSGVNQINVNTGGEFNGILNTDLNANEFSILDASSYNFTGNTGVGLQYIGNSLFFNGHLIDSNVDDDGSRYALFPALQSLNMSGYQIKNLAAGSDPSDGVTVSQLNTQISTLSNQIGSQLSAYLPRSGGVSAPMTGQLYASQGIQLNSSSITGGNNGSFNSINTDVLNGKSANIIASNSILDMGANIIQNLGTSTDANAACTVGFASQLVNATNHTISGVYRFSQPIYVNGIIGQNSDITNVDNVTANSCNVDSIQANAGGGVVFNSLISLTNPQTGVANSIQGAYSVTAKNVEVDTQISIGPNIILAPGSFNMGLQPILNVPDGQSSAPMNAINYQTAQSLVTTTNLTATGPLLMQTYPVISHNSPSVSGHLVNLHHFEHNSIHSNTYYINDNQTDIQAVYNDHSNEQGVTYKISSGSYGGSTLTISGSHNIHFECSHPGNGSTITELAGSRGLSIQNSSRVRFEGLQIEGDLTINGRWSYGGTTVDTNCIFSCCEILGATNLGNLSAITGFITFYRCTFAGAITYSTGSTATCYFIDCDFGNQNLTNSGSNTRIIISNGARMSNTQQNNYIGYGLLSSPLGIATHVASALATPANATAIQSTAIEVSSDPATNNTLTRKSYVDTKVSSVTAGTAISVTGTATAPVINNTGVTSIIAGDNITIDQSTGAVTITAAGGTGQNASNVAFASSTVAYSEEGPLAIPLANSGYSFTIFDDHFGDSKVALNSTNQLVVTSGGGTTTSRTFELVVSFALYADVSNTQTGNVGVYLADYTGQTRYLAGFLPPQTFSTPTHTVYYHGTFIVTLPYSGSTTQTFTPYLYGSTGDWTNGLSINSWQISNLRMNWHYFGHTGQPVSSSESFTPPVTSSPSINSISAPAVGQISVSYSAVTGATEYLIYKSTDNSTYTLAGSTASTSFTITSGLNNSTLYYIKVAAGNNEGPGPKSSASSITTLDPPPYTFSDMWTDGRSDLVGYNIPHSSSDGVLSAAQIYSIGADNGIRLYFNRRDDSGTWPAGANFSPIFVKAGFPGAGSTLKGNYTSAAQIIAAGGASTFYDFTAGTGLTWGYAFTTSPFNQPYDAVTNPKGYRYISGPTS